MRVYSIIAESIIKVVERLERIVEKIKKCVRKDAHFVDFTVIVIAYVQCFLHGPGKNLFNACFASGVHNFNTDASNCRLHRHPRNFTLPMFAIDKFYGLVECKENPHNKV